MGNANLVMFNPVLLDKKKAYQTEEGCLSLVGSRPTTRYEEITVAYRDVNWQAQTLTFVRVFQPRSVSMKWSSRRRYHIEVMDGTNDPSGFRCD